MTVDELHRTVVEGFAELRRENRESRAAIDARFREMDARFHGIDARFDGIDARFDGIDARFDGIDTRFREMDARFGEMDARFGEMDARFGAMNARFGAMEDTIRRHFDVMVEKVEASVRLVAEGHVHLTTVVGNHEVRLQAIEKRS
jgi:hypothetical protein